MAAEVAAEGRLLSPAQALLERTQERERSHGQGGHGGHENDADDPAAET
jgi:hypothetical protein